MDEPRLTPTEAARELGVNRATIHRRLDAGAMVGERVHRRLWLISRAEVERWKGRGRLKPGRKPQAKPE